MILFIDVDKRLKKIRLNAEEPQNNRIKQQRQWDSQANNIPNCFVLII